MRPYKFYTFTTGEIVLIGIVALRVWQRSQADAYQNHPKLANEYLRTRSSKDATGYYRGPTKVVTEG